jgi:hypothetical protein
MANFVRAPHLLLGSISALSLTIKPSEATAREANSSDVAAVPTDGVMISGTFPA